MFYWNFDQYENDKVYNEYLHKYTKSKEGIDFVESFFEPRKILFYE
jgi:hypothetical protein